MAPVEDENVFPLTHASPTRGEGKNIASSTERRGKKNSFLLP